MKDEVKHKLEQKRALLTLIDSALNLFILQTDTERILGIQLAEAIIDEIEATEK